MSILAVGHEESLKTNSARFNARRPWPVVHRRLFCRASAGGVCRKQDPHLGRLNKHELMFPARQCRRQGQRALSRRLSSGQTATPRWCRALLNSNLTTESKLSLRELGHRSVGSIAVSIAATDDIERSMTGWPEIALGVSPFPQNLVSSRNPKNAIFSRWGTKPSARALGGLLINCALPQSHLFFH